jgi:hypothetical protein
MTQSEMTRFCYQVLDDVTCFLHTYELHAYAYALTFAINICACACISCMYVCVWSRMHMTHFCGNLMLFSCVYTCVYAVCIYIHTRGTLCMCNVYIYIHTHTHTHTHTWGLRLTRHTQDKLTIINPMSNVAHIIRFNPTRPT